MWSSRLAGVVSLVAVIGCTAAVDSGAEDGSSAWAGDTSDAGTARTTPRGADGTVAAGGEGGETVQDAGHGDAGVDSGLEQAAPPTDADGVDASASDDSDRASATSTAVAGLVRGDIFTSLVLELDAVDGTAPTEVATSLVTEQLTGLILKPDGITLMSDQAVESRGAEHAWAEAELRALAAETRTIANTTDRVVIHVLALDGHKDTDTAELTTLGLSWGNDTVVLFTSTIEESCTTRAPRMLSSTRFCDQAVASIWMHEIGHLLGLVNLGLPMQHAHEDAEHLGHCDDPQCLMYWAYHRTGVVDRLRDRFDTGAVEPPPLDPSCAEDLASLRDAP